MPFSGADSGMYTVSGLGSRKQAVRNAGGGTLDLAIAMLHTSKMDTSYAYAGNKFGDAANFGIFMQNWHMIRQTAPQFSGQTSSQWNNGAALNWNLELDVATRKNAYKYYGRDKWFAGHRDGETGLNDPDTDDINLYKAAISWIEEQISSNSKYLSDDTRFWVHVPAS
ncbi:hypothetical protein L873DRAFT_1795193 [Choiromyces venosus 120613-1]|uniref:Uncharacterized protein n=1 Tax=Choiromyces venosus 120613-1 TaxID=1336337 RepID=A0A3N4IY39_9PEZI|nr:hypothetical protein L873DRAFT_1795193 [Choiromyces venosus 120613-1]